jgi:hypothetical protein
MIVEPVSKTFLDLKDRYSKSHQEEMKNRYQKNKTKIKSSVDSPTKIKEDDNIIGWA